MSTTPARRARRAAAQVQAQAVKLKTQSNAIIIADMKALYKENPNKALEYCHAVVGKNNFQNALRAYLPRFLADIAFVLALKKCLEYRQEQIVN